MTAPALHSMECSCSACEPSAPANPNHLDAQAKAKLAIAAAIVGTAISLLIDPAGTVEALRSVLL